jgi:hypothetical protein
MPVREWSADDLKRWDQQLKESELTYTSQLELAQFCNDMWQSYTQVRAELERLRTLWSLMSMPLGQIIELVRQNSSGVVDDGLLLSGVRFWVTNIEQDILE